MSSLLFTISFSRSVQAVVSGPVWRVPSVEVVARALRRQGLQLMNLTTSDEGSMLTLPTLDNSQVSVEPTRLRIQATSPEVV